MNEHKPAQNYSLDELRILIASTPKTGNTWLRHLLAAIYNLPTVKLDFPFDPAHADTLGPRWIAHQHYALTPALRDWAAQRNVVVITTARHPGDVLLSLYHYVRSYNERLEFYQLAELGADDGTFGAPVRSAIHTHFKDLVAISADWASSGVAHVVKYEQLFFDPVATLTALTDEIVPVSRDHIERAIERCDIRVMRTLADENSSFFRQGGYGGWRNELPSDIIELLRTTEPYPANFATLGYTLAPEDEWSSMPVQRIPAKAGFFDRFDHSPAATALFKSIYLSFETEEAQRRWPDMASAAMPTAFHTWLHAPADDDPQPATEPVITNLVAQVYQARSDVRAAFPDVYGQNRVDVTLWFVAHAARTYQLDDAFVRPLHDWLAAWAMQPNPHDPEGIGPDAGLPVLPNLVSYLYHRRADVYGPFPDLYGQHRIDVMFWMLANIQSEYHLEDGFVAPIRQALLAWAAQPDPSDSAKDNMPALTNLAIHIYHRRPDLQAAFPDLYGQDRIAVALWILTHVTREYQLDDAFIAPLRQALLTWATQPDPRDPAAGDVPVLTNLATYVYHRRPDMHTALTDLYGRDRLDVMLWMIGNVAREYQLDDAFIAPLRHSFLAWALRTDLRGAWRSPRFAYFSRYLFDRNAIKPAPAAVVLRAMTWLSALRR